MTRLLFLGLACVALAACAGGPLARAQDSEDAVILSRLRPDPAYTEKRGDLTRLNFDFELANRSEEDVEITFVGMRVYDAEGHVLTRRYMGGNGLPGPIAMLAEATIPAGGTRYVFNPFPDLALAAPAANAQVVVAYTGGGVLYFDVPFETPPGPVLDRPPLDGVSYVYSGNDLFAHHRRVSLDSEAARGLGMEHVAQRFALDFTRLDPKSGDLAANEGAAQSDWYGFGAKVYAPIAGRVVAARADMPDNTFDEDGQRIFADGFEIYGEDRGLGNYLTLELAGGAHLILAHFVKGTLTAEVGDVVDVGAYLGEIGMSGDTAYPHLHIQLQDGPDYIQSRPLPISFACVDLGVLDAGPGAVDTGDFLSPCKG
ncbi:MAG: M23 family metallopeptidase [Pseudomonadota bacterium]